MDKSRSLLSTASQKVSRKSSGGLIPLLLFFFVLPAMIAAGSKSAEHKPMQVIARGNQLVAESNARIKLGRQLLAKIDKDIAAIEKEKDLAEYAKSYKVCPKLVAAMVQQESGWNPKALSPKGAAGLLQLMPATAKDLGVTDRFNPTENIKGGIRYMGYLLQRYNGNERLALAAYNAGMANVDKYKGVPPFKETQDYVRTIMRSR
jgi:soluble lytic murein transglycosylase-like protein